VPIEKNLAIKLQVQHNPEIQYNPNTLNSNLNPEIQYKPNTLNPNLNPEIQSAILKIWKGTRRHTNRGI